MLVLQTLVLQSALRDTMFDKTHSVLNLGISTRVPVINIIHKVLILTNTTSVLIKQWLHLSCFALVPESLRH